MQYYDEQEENELQTQANTIQAITDFVQDHPYVTVTVPSLLASFAVDIAVSFSWGYILGGLFVAGILCKESDFIVSRFLPGSNVEEVRQVTQQAVDRLVPDFPQYADQRPVAKLKRIFGIREGLHMQTVAPQKQQDTSVGESASAAKLALEIIVDMYEDGAITNAEFVALLRRLPDTHDEYEDFGEDEPVTRNDRNGPNLDAQSPPQVTVSTVTASVNPVTPSGWSQQQIVLLPGLYCAHESIDKCLASLGMSTSQVNRNFVRDVLKQHGLWKGDK